MRPSTAHAHVDAGSFEGQGVKTSFVCKKVKATITCGDGGGSLLDLCGCGPCFPISHEPIRLQGKRRIPEKTESSLSVKSCWLRPKTPQIPKLGKCGPWVGGPNQTQGEKINVPMNGRNRFLEIPTLGEGASWFDRNGSPQNCGQSP